MTGNEINDAVVFKIIAAIIGTFATLWAIASTFATKKELDRLVTRVDELEAESTKSRVVMAELRMEIRSLGVAVRDLTSFLRRGSPTACAITMVPSPDNPDTGDNNGR